MILSTGLMFAQNHEFSIDFRYGISHNNLSPTQTAYGEIRNPRTLNDQGFLVMYKYQFWKKRHLYVSGGIEFSQSRHYQPLIGSGSGYHLDNILINKNRMTFHLGLNKQFHLYDDKLILDFGIHLIHRSYGSLEDDISAEYQFSIDRPWIEYTYDFKTFYGDEHFATGIPQGFVQTYNLDFNTQVKFRIKSQFFLNVGLSYSRNNVFFYTYSNTARHYLNGSPTSTSQFSYTGLQDDGGPKGGIRDHFIYLSAGLSYKFNWKK
jgi:hypothetical protein